MKKVKKFFYVALFFVLLWGVASCNKENGNDGNQGEDGGEENQPETVIVLTNLELDTSNVKTDYYLGENLDTSNLKVTAVYKNVFSSEITREEVTNNIKIDDSKFDNKFVGTYDIFVTYDSGSEYYSKSYQVNVKDVLGLLPNYVNGLSVSLENTTYNVGEALNLETLVVTAYYKDGSSKVVNEGEYELDTTKLDMSKAGNNQELVVKYSETYEYDGVTRIVEVSNFVLIDVMDVLTGISFVSGNTIVEQGNSIDTSDWIVEASYQSGAKYNISGFTVTANTSLPGTTNATITYEENGVTKTCSVEITVNPSSATTIKYEFNASNLELATLTSNLVSEDGIYTILANTSEQVVIDANNKSIDDYKFTKRIKLGGEGSISSRSIKVDLTNYPSNASVKLVVYAISSSSSADRTLLLGDSTFTNVLNEFSVLGAAINKNEATINGGQEYYLYSSSGGINVYCVYVEISM